MSQERMAGIWLQAMPWTAERRTEVVIDFSDDTHFAIKVAHTMSRDEVAAELERAAISIRTFNRDQKA